jgi:hypothetical protein
MAKSASPSTSQSLSEAHAQGNGQNPFRTFHGLVKENKLTVRRLCSELKVAAESLRAAYDEPGRLSLNAVMAFSELVGEDPQKVAADLFHEIGELRKKGPAPAAPKRSRTLKPKTKPQENEGE